MEVKKIKPAPPLYDPMIISRVKQYLEDNVHQTYVDVGVMARVLQDRYREYSRRKTVPFRQLVEQAYKTVLHSYGLDSNPSSDENDVSSDLEMMEERPDGNHMNNILTNMYVSNKPTGGGGVGGGGGVAASSAPGGGGSGGGSGNDGELIDISSDDSGDDENSTNGIADNSLQAKIKDNTVAVATNSHSQQSNKSISPHLEITIIPVGQKSGKSDKSLQSPQQTSNYQQQQQQQQQPTTRNNSNVTGQSSILQQQTKKRKLPDGDHQQTNIMSSAPKKTDLSNSYEKISGKGTVYSGNGSTSGRINASKGFESQNAAVGGGGGGSSSTAGGSKQSTGGRKFKKEWNVEESTLKFRDIGGIEKILQELCELLMHIKHPEVYRHIGLPPPRGFLLHGPPGCGKTLLAQAIAGELGVGLMQVAATELVAGVSGESEERIRELFDQAAALAPCVLFIDEIDAISSNRLNAQKDMERRIVAQLLSSFDGLAKHVHGDQVLIIGATNRPDSLDPALRRVGRFDQEISLGIPDRSARQKILRVICSNLVLHHPFDFDSIAALTPGYVGADLLALATRAASIAIKRSFSRHSAQTYINVANAVDDKHRLPNTIPMVNLTDDNILAGQVQKFGETIPSINLDNSSVVIDDVSSVDDGGGDGGDGDGGDKQPMTSNETLMMELDAVLNSEKINEVFDEICGVDGENKKENGISKDDGGIVTEILDIDDDNATTKVVETLPDAVDLVDDSTKMETDDIEENVAGNDDVVAADIISIDNTISTVLDPNTADSVIDNKSTIGGGEEETTKSPSTEIEQVLDDITKDTAIEPNSNGNENVVAPNSVNDDKTNDDSATIVDLDEEETLGEALLTNTAIKRQITLNEMLKWLHDENPPIGEEELLSLSITIDDFKEAVKLVQPSAKREGFITVPDVTWDDIGSLRNIREELQLSVLAPVKFPEKLKQLGLVSPSGVLLCGPPGCGKTLLAKAVANEAGINFISVKGPELLNMYVGESERAVRQCFQRAKNSSPCVIFFDEFDALCPTRSGNSENNSSSRVVNQLLTEMDGVEDRKGVFVMAATNRPDIVDPAVLRPGRLDKILFVGLPAIIERQEILETITKKKPVLAENVSLSELAELTENFTGADLAGLVRQASLHALKSSISQLDIATTATDSGETDESSSPMLSVNRDNFMDALKHIRPSVSEEDKRHYARLRKKFTSQSSDMDV